MQTSNKSGKKSQDKQNRQMMTIAAVAFTLLACFFLIFLFVGPRRNAEQTLTQSPSPMPYYSQRAQPAPAPPPNIDLQVTEQDPNTASPETPTPDANDVTQDGNNLTIPLEPDTNTVKHEAPPPPPQVVPVKPEPVKPVVEPARPVKAPVTIDNPARNAASKGSFRVQAGAYANKANAEKLLADLSRRGYSVEIQSSLAESLTLYKVLIGNFKSREDAQKLANELNSKGNTASVISTK
ncbi:MAG: SPOR domain-containing protein [Armatimonadota bacterium]